MNELYSSDEIRVMLSKMQDYIYARQYDLIKDIEKDIDKCFNGVDDVLVEFQATICKKVDELEKAIISLENRLYENEKESC